MFKESITVPNIDIESILGLSEGSFPTEAKRKKFIDSVYYILYVITIQSTYREQKFLDFGYVPLYSRLLEKMLGKDYTVYLNALLETQTVERDDLYFQGKSYGYRINEKYDLSDFKVFELSTYVLIRKLRSFNNTRIVDAKEEVDESRKLVEHLSFFFEDLSVDYEKALSKLDEIKEALVEEGREKKAKNVYSSCRFTLETLHHKTYRRIFRDATGRRLFTPITSLKRELRQFLFYKGQKLVIIDIANSQPFFINYVLTDYFQPLNVGMEFMDPFEFAAFTCFDKVDKRKSEDVISYKELTSTGKLYDYLIEKLEGDFAFEDRYDFKKWFFKMFYSNNKSFYGKMGVMKRLMQKEFPTIYDYMYLFKEKNHANFPIMMQRVESKLMLDKISTKIMIDEPKIPFFTIHDSILCLEENSEYIKKIMEQEIYSNTGVMPTISLE